jgi:hypothetical protein
MQKPDEKPQPLSGTELQPPSLQSDTILTELPGSNFEVISDKFNLDGICTTGNYTQKQSSKLQLSTDGSSWHHHI